MLESVLQTLSNYEPTISSIVGLLTLCAAIWGILQLTVTGRLRSSQNPVAGEVAATKPKRVGWASLVNLGLSEHSKLEELVSVRTVNVVFFCLLIMSFPWLLLSLQSTSLLVLTAVNLLVFVSALLGFALQRAGATGAARWLLIVVSAIYWLGCILAVGAMQGTEYFLAALLALPVLVFSRVNIGQLFLSVVFLIAVFALGVYLTLGGTRLLAQDEAALLIRIGYYSNAFFLAAVIFVTVNYYKGFASSSYQMLASQKQHNEALVAKLLPQSIARQMVSREVDAAQWRPDATVLFATLTGFTQLYSRLPAMELVAHLDTLYSRFDELINEQDIDKVKTLGTTYVAAVGIDSVSSDARAIPLCCLAMRKIVTDFARENELPIGFRCGIATGLTISGVIGKSRPRFDIWGEALEAATALQAQANEGDILVNQTAYWRMREHFQFSGDEAELGPIRLLSELAPRELTA